MTSKLLIVVLVVVIVEEVYAEKKKENRPGRNPDTDRFDEVFSLIKNTFIIAIMPALLTFFHSIVTDPALFSIMKRVASLFKKRILTNLGNNFGNGSTIDFGGHAV